ncbi:Dabb family protein [Aquipuribacter sp. SD81]|uniref:Dabb family protein n=1 Tax=Aquipuribacter sp. SD81 TaxID=3127703 RepID=UPI0030182A3D
MIEHTVSFRLVHPEGSEAEVRFLTDARETLSRIPGVTDLVVNRQVSPKSDHRFQLAMRFADEQAYRAYDEHPDHRAFVEDRWLPEVAAFQELDLVRW